MKNAVKKIAYGLLALAMFGLAACGGYTTVNLGGSVNGLVTSGLVIANADQTLAVAKDATVYVFPNKIDDHGSFAITIQTQPPRLTCLVSGGTGVTTGIPITTANIYCSFNSYTVGGTITGLTSEGLSVTNGADNLAIAGNSSIFTMAQPVIDGAVYGLAILSQPAGQKCTLKNGTSTMGSAPVTNIAITCI
jgi:hypothetical protein